MYSGHVYKATILSVWNSEYACAECSNLDAAGANNSSNHVATFPLSVATEQRVEQADRWTIFSPNKPNGTVLGWWMLGFSGCLYGSGSFHRHWKTCPLDDSAINSEYKLAIWTNLGAESGQNSKSSEIHRGHALSFFL